MRDRRCDSFQCKKRIASGQQLQVSDPRLEEGKCDGFPPPIGYRAGSTLRVCHVCQTLVYLWSSAVVALRGHSQSHPRKGLASVTPRPHRECEPISSRSYQRYQVSLPEGVLPRSWLKLDLLFETADSISGKCLSIPCTGHTKPAGEPSCNM